LLAGNVLLGRVLAAEDFGLVTAWLNVLLLLGPIATLGIDQAIVREAKNAPVRAWKRLAGGTFLASLGFGATIGLAFMAVYRASLLSVMAFLLCLPLSASVLLMVGVLRAGLRVVVAQTLSQLWKWVFLVGTIMVFLVLRAGTVSVVLIALLAGFLCSAALGALLCSRFHASSGARMADPPRFLQLVPIGVGFLISSGAAAMLLRADRILLPIILGNAALADYQANWLVIVGSASIGRQALGFVLMPVLALSRTQAQRRAALRRIGGICGGLALLLLVVVPHVAPVFVARLFSGRYLTDPMLTRMLCVMAVLHMAVAIPSSVVGANGSRNALLAYGLLGWVSVSVSIAGVTLLSSELGNTGVALGAVIGRLVRLVTGGGVAWVVWRRGMGETPDVSGSTS